MPLGAEVRALRSRMILGVSLCNDAQETLWRVCGVFLVARCDALLTDPSPAEQEYDRRLVHSIRSRLHPTIVGGGSVRCLLVIVGSFADFLTQSQDRHHESIGSDVNEMGV